MTKPLPMLLLLLLVSCSPQPEPEKRSEPVYSKQYRSQALTAIISLSETNIPSAGSVTVLLEIHTPNHIEPLFPDLGHFIKPFRVSDEFTEPVQPLPNGKNLHRKLWVLLPAMPGETVFQPMVITAGDAQLTTEPIAVSVISLLPEGTTDPVLRDIAGPIQHLPEQQRRRSVYTVVGAVLALVLLPFLLLYRRKPGNDPVQPPQETARQALEKLPADPVQRIHELNMIFRVYHEARFGVPMVGKTAVELSALLEDTDTIQFLEKCDDVRFSNLVPPGFADEAEQFVRCKTESQQEVSD